MPVSANSVTLSAALDLLKHFKTERPRSSGDEGDGLPVFVSRRWRLALTFGKEENVL
jgi:hypothetical protein